jgi:hypothetical protein
MHIRGVRDAGSVEWTVRVSQSIKTKSWLEAVYIPIVTSSVIVIEAYITIETWAILPALVPVAGDLEVPDLEVRNTIRCKSEARTSAVVSVRAEFNCSRLRGHSGSLECLRRDSKKRDSS